ncbi:RidA family protein [Spirosoma sp. HMF4905]|uniref:RidA family protein n=1 Tax=Spirosoma arboris TaxID=2682092 RepID=A0A7K1SDV7_9BACT|nr:RidA family protein [Spirosoma arboris]MVM31979.1 RidA family protein [Spirosoma arboris]
MNHIRQFLLLLSLLLSAPALFGQQLQYINPPGLPTSKNYTQIVVIQASRVAYISGQVSSNAKGEIINKGDFRGQTKQVLENLKIALASMGATFADVIKTTTYVVNTDAEKIGIVREIRGQYFTAPNPPASTYVGVQGLYDKDVLIEIEATVALK